MAKTLSIKALEVKSFVTTNQINTIKGGNIPTLPPGETQGEICVSICTCTNNVMVCHW